MIARAHIALIAVVAGGCSAEREAETNESIRKKRAEAIQERAWRSAPCPNQKCRPLPDGLHGVSLGMSRETVADRLGELEPIERPEMVCAEGVAAFDAATEIGGEAATCSLDFVAGELAQIACALDGVRSVAEHKAIGWALYQTLARQYGRAAHLDDALMSRGRLSARWRGGARTLDLRLEVLGDRSIIRLSNRSSARSTVRCESADGAEVYEAKNMERKARAFLRDLTGPLESEGQR